MSENLTVYEPKSSLTDDEIKTLKEKCLESLSIDYQHLIVKQSFCANVILRFNVVPVRDVRLSTACTDGNKIYFDIDFYKKLNKDERMFVLAHEVWHNITLYFKRKLSRDSNLWNIAADCEVNNLLVEDGLSAPENVCFAPPEDRGKNAEEIYEKLLKKHKKDPQNGVSDYLGGEKGNNDNGKTFKSSNINSQFDKHIKQGEDDGDEKNNNSPMSDSWGEKGFDTDYNPNVSENVAEKIREIVISEAQKYERKRGTLPSTVKQIVDKLIEPEISWKEILSEHVTSCFGDNRQWLPPQRRHVWHEAYFQSRRSKRIQVACIVDTSGSTTEDLPKFLTELVSLMNTFGNYNLILIQNDAKVQKVDVYDENNPFPLENVNEIEWCGFGGSDLNPAFEYLKDVTDIPYDDCVVFTDGEIAVPENNPLGCPVLGIVTKDGCENFCDWMKIVKFNE